MSYKKIRKKVDSILKSDLNETLTYHGHHHAVDVLKCVSRAIKHYSIDEQKSELLKIAAISHDIGYTDTYKGHEERGVEIVSDLMESEGYNKKEIAFVRKMILATKPEKTTNSLEEKIMKDADLDYLGRRDFYKIAKTLFDEWVAHGIIVNDFNLFEKQELNFLQNHKYLTDYSREKRGPGKQKRIQELQKKLDIG